MNIPDRISPIVAYMLKIAFENSKGFITDFGEEQIATDPKTGEELMRIPRYGVWQKDPVKRKPQVIFTSNDLEECKAKLK